MPQRIQTFLFSKSDSPNGINGGKGWTAEAARGWLSRHGYHGDKIDDGEENMRFRQFEPETCEVDSYQTLTEGFPAGIQAVSCETEGGAERDAALGPRVRHQGHPVERVAVPFEIHDFQPATGRFKGYATAYGTLVDTHPLKTLIKHGAFDESLLKDKGRIKILWQHNPDEPIGLPESIRQTDKGLEIQARISDTQRGRDAMTLMRDGVISELSVGFDPISTSLTQHGGEQVRLMEKGSLWEVSLVTWGANRGAKILEVNRQSGTAQPPAEAELLPIADFAREFDAAEARKRIVAASLTEGGGDLDFTKLSRAFAVAPADARKLSDFLFPIADVIDGELRAIPQALFMAARRVESTAARRVVERYYEAMGRVTPWARTDEAHAKIEAIASLRLATDMPEEHRAQLRDALVWLGGRGRAFHAENVPREFIAAQIDTQIRHWRQRAATADAESAPSLAHALSALQALRQSVLGSMLSPEKGSDSPKPPKPVDVAGVDARAAKADALMRSVRVR